MFKNILYLVAFGLVIGKTNCFNYDTQGPDTWPKYEKGCDGLEQSPIDIYDAQAIHNEYLREFNFINYDSELNWTAIHNGKSVSLKPEAETLQLSGSDFTETFQVVEIHLHWGENDYQGSEHYLEGQKFPLEMHFVHYSKHSNRYAVLGFLFELNDENNTNLEPLIQVANELRAKNSTTQLSVAMVSILPNKEDLRNYYRYRGSLTTPPCSQGLIWTVFQEKISISKNQMAAFHSNVIKKNFRPPQPLNNRIIQTSKNKKTSNDAGTTNQPHQQGCNSAIQVKQSMAMKSVLFFMTLVALKNFVCY